jgi:glycosyltransferase involved in cell wall biosynthesis
MEPLRVILVSHRYPPDAVAGVERYTEALAASLARRGDDVTVVTRRPGGGPRPAIVNDSGANGVRVCRLAGGNSDRGSVFGGHDHDRLERLFETIIAELAPDVVHFNHLIDLSPRFVEIAARFGAAVVMTLHDFYFACPRITLQKPSGELCRGPDGGRECARTCFRADGVAGGCDARSAAMPLGLRAMYFRRLLDVPRFVLCPSRYVADYFQRHGVEAARLRVVPNGTWVEAGPAAVARVPGPDHATPAERGRLNLAFLGSVLRHKGVHVLLDAIDLARRDGGGVGPVKLDLLGPADDPRYARELRDRAGTIPGLALNFHGIYQPAALPGLLRDVDCVVAPSQWPETFLLVSREALALGVPVVVSDLGALPDCVTEGESGFVFEHDRPDRLAGILRKLALDGDLVRRLRKGARATPIFSSRDHADAVRRIYLEAMCGAAGGSAESRHGGELAFLESALHDVETVAAG